MNCHDDKKETPEINNNPKHSGHNHGLMMILCFIPIIIIMLLSMSGKIDNLSKPLLFLIILLCPLSHVLMMFGMKKNHHQNNQDKE